MHILLIDDDAGVRGAMIRILEGSGHTVCRAASGEAGLRLMRSEKVDLIILDMLLGAGMTGWDVAREKLLDGSIRSIPVIVVSGLPAHEVREGAQVVSNALAGAMLIMTKPINVKELEHAIELLDKSRKTPTP